VSVSVSDIQITSVFFVTIFTNSKPPLTVKVTISGGTIFNHQ
jgi:hypothetical protein